ncbi:MAG: DNA alkylation repair protein [Endomicrobium sp.]|jgi:3-methyladenine DNA glycosylase AlkD|nr:DNA alkylation repair protein [Endomicrobium sp.]
MAGKIKNIVLNELKSVGDKKVALYHAAYFQTYKGGYGQGDLFWGLRAAQQRKIAKKYYKEIPLKDTEDILKHKIHEARLTALMIMILKYEKASEVEKAKIASLYLKNTKYVNNWDLVDLSAHRLSGDYWYHNCPEQIWKYAKSGNLWDERIAMISTFYFIKCGRFDETIALCETFLNHKHDLMHKASGWMLREMGKRDEKPLYVFLDKYSKIMPRTMLRYSIEKLQEKKRRYYMEM